jgi:hypothetical protein
MSESVGGCPYVIWRNTLSEDAPIALHTLDFVC